LYGYVVNEPINSIDLSGLVRFRGGTLEQRQRAEDLQESLLHNLKRATIDFFQGYYGIDIVKELQPCGGPEVDLDDGDDPYIRNGAWGHTDRWNNIALNIRALEQSELFQADLLHELVHWSANKAGLFFARRPTLDPVLMATIMKRADELTEGTGRLSFASHSKPPYAAEYLQFGDLVTLRYIN